MSLMNLWQKWRNIKRGKENKMQPIFNIEDLKQFFNEVLFKESGISWDGQWYDPRCGNVQVLDIEAIENGYGRIELLDLQLTKDNDVFVCPLSIDNEEVAFWHKIGDSDKNTGIFNYGKIITYKNEWQELLLKNHPKEMSDYLAGNVKENEVEKGE